MQTKRKRWTPEEDAVIMDIKSSSVKSTRFKLINGAKRVLKGRTAGAIAQRLYKVGNISTEKVLKGKGLNSTLMVKVEKDHIRIYFK